LSEDERIYYVNRTVCDILKDMRDTIKAGIDLLDEVKPASDATQLEQQFYKSLRGAFLIQVAQVEELQFYANRMEANLQDVKDVKELLVERSKLKREVFKLREEKKQLLKDSVSKGYDNYGTNKFVFVKDDTDESIEDAMKDNPQ
jgi:predicted nuclease with TOPRIM domain